MGKGRNRRHGGPRLSGTAVLRDKFVPSAARAFQLAPVASRWVLCNEEINADGSPNDMTPVIARMAESFVPRVRRDGPGEPPHGPYYYGPSSVHRVPPDLQFALNDSQATRFRFDAADLDETTSINEYASTFRGALRSEHEERMRMYETYSLLKWPVKQFQSQKAKAVLFIGGISDARPSLQVGDIVLLRPVQPLVALSPNRYGTLVADQYTIEIETRIMQLVRGRGGRPDQVIISWAMSLEQRDALKDHAWVREYTVRFVPSSEVINRCLTALDWLENLSAFHHRALQDILFPVTAPVVRPLTAEQRRLYRAVPSSPASADDSSQTDAVVDLCKPLNELQVSFVRMVRARTKDPSFEATRPPMILTGPAGTGKTKSLICAIADALGLLQPGQSNGQHGKNKNRVLICCPSHAASDVLTRQLNGLLKRSEIFRLYDSSRPSSTVPGSILPFTCQVPGTDRFTLPPPSVWTNLKAVLCTCLDAHLLFRAQITNQAIRIKRQCFQTYILSESDHLGLNFSNLSMDNTPYFTHLFIDEAAQATEPEILVPVSCVVDPGPNCRKVEIALIGDPRQLSPRVYASDVANSLGRSLMERLLRRPVTCLGGGEASLLGPAAVHENAESLEDLIRYYANVDGQEQLTIFLTENYRGHPCHLMMPSSFFYSDRLRSTKVLDRDNLAFWCDKLRMVEALSTPVSVSIEPPRANGTLPEIDMFSQIRRQITWPMHFRGVIGSDSSSSLEHFSGTDSWQNADEAQVVVGIIHCLIANGVEPSRIGAMSPFRGQVLLIRRLLREKYYHDVNVGTIDNYQAVEQDVIVLSLTRSNEDFVHHDVKKRMGIFGQPKQLNVAMTRAENLFIVVGNPNVMWHDPCWRQWLRFCCRNGLWYGQNLKKWENGQSISLKDMRFVSTLDMSAKPNDAEKPLVVVSTLEKIYRVH